MASWNVYSLLNHAQELMGEPVGAFFNISTRLDQMNQAQRELNDETRAITDADTVAVVAGTRDYNLPLDFLTFERETPTFLDQSGNRHRVTVVDPAWLDARYPSWQDLTTHTGTPLHLFVRNGALTIYPTPDSAGTLTVPYVVEPAELTQMSDVPFNGLARLNRFAPALAYKVAFVNTIARAPQLASMFLELYERQERLMRHFTRTNPQHKPGVRPVTEY
jgi:hypothetical protein